jgi:hypothetical protein
MSIPRCPAVIRAPFTQQYLRHARKAAIEVTAFVLSQMVAALDEMLERNEFPHWDGVSQLSSMRLSDGSFNSHHWHRSDLLDLLTDIKFIDRVIEVID